MSGKFFRRLFLISLLINSTPIFALELDKIELPDMGDSAGALISPAEEKQFGEAFFRSLHNQVVINQDSEIQQYIQTIGEKLVAHSDTPNYPFHFFVVLENDINAFAGPGGYIGVNSGLILMTDAESELASVMAHEIAHVTQRHLYRSYEASSRLSIPMAAATLGAILLGTQSAAAGQAAIMAIQAGSVQFQIDFTREHEAEADRVGMQTLSNSTYDPRSMPTFFERLQQSTRYSGQNVPEFLRTHPVTASRISDSRGRADNYPYKQYPDSLTYQLIKTKLQVLLGNDSNDIRAILQARLHQGLPEQRTVAQYGLGLLALKTQNFAEAETIFQTLVKDNPEQSHYAAALARTALESNNYKLALTRYQKLATQFPDNDAIRLEYVGASLKTGDPSTAKNVLIALSPKTQKLPIFSQLLAQVYGDLNQPAESHRYLADYYFAIGETQQAILQLQLAQQIKGISPQMVAILREKLTFLWTVDEQERRNR
ncbi:MAG: M48 family metalloprotease [Methylococcales bacterium]|nr:M48 family metalloprotease [Methylococcales bacterium]MDD5754547.1 M48 family metalloprotease [Methylococcales bacterium]